MFVVLKQVYSKAECHYNSQGNVASRKCLGGSETCVPRNTDKHTKHWV